MVFFDTIDTYIVRCFWVLTTPPLTPFKFMDSFKIDYYVEQLQGMCENCRKFKRCKDKKAICFRKRFAFNLALIAYKKREGTKELNEHC